MNEKLIDYRIIPDFQIGDKVRVIVYGHLIHSSKSELKTFRPLHILYEDNDYIIYDIRPEIIGEIGIVDKVSTAQNRIQYSLQGTMKCAWYDEKQLELVK